ncbi:MAG: DUF308 domain-containing protein [Candidatus Micrarchaeia archaeon]
MAKKKGDIAEKAGWLLGISGLLMLIIGILLFFTPQMTIETAVLLMGAVFAVGGALKIGEALFACKNANFASNIAISGAFALVVGLIMLFGSGFVTGGVIVMFGALAALLGLVALVTGVGQVAYGLKAKKGRMLSLAAGVVLIALGAVMLFNLLGSAIALIMINALFMMIYGMVMIVLALNIREYLH